MPDATPTKITEPPPRPLRADAQRNYDLIVATAAAAFGEHGAEASLEDIAKRAGVGIGTLYRHFPTREALTAAVMREDMAAVIARAEELMSAPSPVLGLARWLDDLIRHLTRFRGVCQMIAASYDAAGEPLAPSCDALAAACGRLVRRAQDAGEISPDVTADDVVMCAHAAAWVGEQRKDPDSSARVLAMLLSGLRASRAAPAAKRRAPRKRKR